MVNDTPFSPDWVSPPGATIATILEELGATPSELARWIERSTDDVEGLLVGRAEITADVARRLASVLGASEAFWRGASRNTARTSRGCSRRRRCPKAWGG